MSTSGISPGFPGLSQLLGHVTHVLLTRSRLCHGPKPASSLHLHVLSTPPAFVLSQDQTLRERHAYLSATEVTSRYKSDTEELSVSVLRAGLVHRADPGSDGMFLSSLSLESDKVEPLDAIRGPPWDHRIAHAVEFSKTACALRSGDSARMTRRTPEGRRSGQDRRV